VELTSKVPGHGRARALVAAFAVAAARAAADEPTSTPAPDPALAGSSSGIDDAALPELPEVVVVGRRPRGEVERDPTASATVIAADRFAGEAKGAAALAATAPGVAVNEYGGLGHLTTVSIRGASASGVLVLLDGLPLDSALGGGVDLATIPRSWIDRIEIVRGAEGAHYGAGALGGIVNVVTRGGARGWALETGAGSFGTYSASAEGSARAGGATFLASLTAEQTAGGFPYRYDTTPSLAGDAARTVDAVRENDAVRRAGAVVKATWMRGTTRLDAAIQASAARRQLPGDVDDLTASDWQEDARVLVSARLSRPLGERLVLAARPSLRLDRVDARLEGALAEQRGTALGLQGEARLAHGASLLRATVDAETETLRADLLDRTRSRGTFAAAVSEDLSLAGGRVRLGPAVRAERVGEFSGLSAKGGASVRLFGPLAARASAGSTFRAPSFSELYLKAGLVQPNPDLKPEEGLGADAGLVAEHRIGFASVGAHTTVYRDLIFYEPATHGTLKPQNSSKALVRGLEVEAALAPVRALAGLSLSGSYTLLDTRILRGVEWTIGNELPYRARHRLYARAAVAPGPFEAHAELHHVGSQFRDSSALRVTPAATTWNAGASVRLARRPTLHLHAEVRNLLDDRTLQDALGNPLPSRTVFLTLRAGPALSEGAP
jgi:iron complex outermembrane receptor protein